METIELSIWSSEQYDADLRDARPAKKVGWRPSALRHGDAFSDARKAPAAEKAAWVPSALRYTRTVTA